ncbi:unnamed protein product, partial [Acanthoscelides obtectus]
AETTFVAASYTGGRDFVRQAFLRTGIPLLGLSPIISSLAPSTFTQYNSYYHGGGNAEVCGVVPLPL